VPSGYVGTLANAPLLPHNVQKARELLAEAGFPNGITLKTIHTPRPGMMTFMEAVQAQLRRAGITLEITPVEHATFHQQIRQNLSQVVHFQAARFPVADVYLSQFFHSRATVGTPTGVTNFSHCKVADAEIDFSSDRKSDNADGWQTVGFGYDADADHYTLGWGYDGSSFKERRSYPAAGTEKFTSAYVGFRARTDRSGHSQDVRNIVLQCVPAAGPAAVPEPGTWAAAALLVAGAALMRWRKCKQVA
jgi:ABC-type transport system substrate-binding protein